MKPQNKLKQYLAATKQFTPSETDNIANQFKLLELNANTCFISGKANEPIIGFLAEGVLKAIDKNNNKWPIHYFLFENNFFSESNLLFKHQPAQLDIQAITPCKILAITETKLQNLKKSIPAIEVVFLQISQTQLLDIQDAYQISKIKEAKERYAALEKTYTKQHLIPRKDIAAFMGITPSSFSRLMRTIKK